MDADQTRATPQRAAELLGISVEAVRQRIRRGTLRSEKDEDGSVWVHLDESVRNTDGVQTDDQTIYTTHLETEIAYLRQQLEQANERDREQRRIIAALTSRIPELPAPRGEDSSPSEPSEAPREEAESPGPRERPFIDEERAQEAAQPRSWWRRMFGG